MSPARILRNEFLHFAERLNNGARRLVASEFCLSLATPLVEIFVTAFVWRTTGSFTTVMLYAAARFIALPVAFWLNGYLLRYIPISRAMWIGAASAGLVTAAVALFDNAGPLAFIFYGLLNGIGWGFYWSNRNYLALQETKTEERRYFLAITSSLALASGVVVPFIGGWLITAGPHLGWFELRHGYWIVLACAVLFMLSAAYIISGGTFAHARPRTISRLLRSTFWSQRRLLSIMRSGIDINKLFIPLVVLALLGHEGILGTLAAVASLLAAFALYAYGRMRHDGAPVHALLATSALYVACTVALIMLPGPLNVILFAIAVPVLVKFYSSLSDRLILDASDTDTEEAGARYSLVFDNELFLNIGRVGFIVLTIIIGAVFSTETVLVLAPLVIAGTQFAFLAAILRPRQ